MLLISGPSGSGKTSVLPYLNVMGLNIIPTYTTRPPRPDDKYTECISKNKFDKMELNKEFISSSIYSTVFGDKKWGIKLSDCNDDSVVITSVEYYIDFKSNYQGELYLVHIDVDDESIIKTCSCDIGRGLGNDDLKSRLKRDKYKMDYLREHADYVITNHNFIYTPSQIASKIYLAYSSETMK